ncbi:SAV_6107 family HEPN domain-containing protein [Dietzia sp.]|uniref:SAV_6107 family HEPN domain-containing protein n=1 Tax=Dietzia sp. TaxID=1871616 RepID=UPI002FDAA850
MLTTPRHAIGASAGRMRMAEELREAAVSATDPADRFLYAYKGARAAAALLLGPRPRRGRNNVWIRLARERPQFAEWAEALGGYSPLASAVDACVPRPVSSELASDFLWAVGRFFDLVESELGSPAAAA